MSSDDNAISVLGVSKHYLLFPKPEDRLKQSVIPRLQRLLRRPQKQYYRNFPALNGVSFAVRRGETVGIIGRNGSGKSTLLQIICGILQPTSGSVWVNGRISALLELGSGFNREFTGRENVYMSGAILGLSRDQVTARFDAIARFADIGEFIDQPVKTYSSGMQVRLAFATAINVDPEILVVDEALAVGDEAFKRKCYARIEEIQKQAKTVLFVSHGAQTIVQLCTRAVLLDCGELLLQGDPRTVVRQYQRLINANPTSAMQIRKEIQSMCAAEAPALPAASGETAVTAERRSVTGGSNGAAPPYSGGAAAAIAQEEFYVPEMKPQSTVQLEERGARIRDARLLTLDGRQVNMLKLGRRYVLEYYVDFLQDAADVGCGMMIRTVNGARLAGANTRSRPSLRLARVERGQVGLVRVEFSCRLLPATYFVTCGVNGLIEDERLVLHKISDALMFRVLPEKDCVSAGAFDLAPSPEVSIVAAPAVGLEALPTASS
jgi:lipopolysaccharide transport system ATP-binding protein